MVNIVKDVLQKSLPATIPIMFIYGSYSTLYILCLLILLSHRRPGFKWQLIGTMALFVLATISVVTAMIQFIWWGDSGNTFTRSWRYIELVGDISGVACLAIGDAILIYRCYLIWSGNLRVIIIPCMLLLCSFVAGVLIWFTEMKTIIIYFTSILVTNLLVLSLSAGKILAITRQGRNYLPKTVTERYTMAVNFILETGILYILCLIAGFCLEFMIARPRNYFLFSSLIFGLGPIFAAISPTLLVVWIGLKRNGNANENPFHDIITSTLMDGDPSIHQKVLDISSVAIHPFVDSASIV